MSDDVETNLYPSSARWVEWLPGSGLPGSLRVSAHDELRASSRPRIAARGHRALRSLLLLLLSKTLTPLFLRRQLKSQRLQLFSARESSVQRRVTWTPQHSDGCCASEGQVQGRKNTTAAPAEAFRSARGATRFAGWSRQVFARRTTPMRVLGGPGVVQDGESREGEGDAPRCQSVRARWTNPTRRGLVRRVAPHHQRRYKPCRVVEPSPSATLSLHAPHDGLIRIRDRSASEVSRS